MACEPYFIGSHSGASGAWVSGPEDVAPPEYYWGYNRMATIKGIFCAGDASGASSHKFSSGSHAEGRIAAKGALAYILDHPEEPRIDSQTVETLKQRILNPLMVYANIKGFPTIDIHPNYIKPKMFMFRLQKIMDEYAGGVSTDFITSRPFLERGIELLAFLKEDAEKLAAQDLHELLRCWENVHRLWQAEAHVRSILFREETRWPVITLRRLPPHGRAKLACIATAAEPDTNQWEMAGRPVQHFIQQTNGRSGCWMAGNALLVIGGGPRRPDCSS
jgi:adenylylsulfate reductase subunit A